MATARLTGPRGLPPSRRRALRAAEARARQERKEKTVVTLDLAQAKFSSAGSIDYVRYVERQAPIEA